MKDNLKLKPKMPPSQLHLEINPNQLNDFQQFLSLHKKVNNLQKTNNNFSIKLHNQNQQEYSAFLQGIKEIFGIEKLKEIRFCQGKCRDDSNCLNRAKFGGVCWRHKRN